MSQMNFMDDSKGEEQPAPATAQVIPMPNTSPPRHSDRQVATDAGMSELQEKQGRLRTRLQLYVERVNSFTISSGQDLQTAEAIAKELAEFRKDIGFLLDPVIADANRAHKTACAKKNELDKPAEQAFKNIKAKMQAWINEQDRLARERQMQAQLEAQRQMQAQIEAQRQQAALRSAPPSQSAPPVPLFVPPPIQQAQEVTLSGSQLKRPWAYEVENKMELVRAVAQGRVPLDVLEVNHKFLQARVTENRGSLRYPGVRVFQGAQISIR